MLYLFSVDVSLIDDLEEPPIPVSKFEAHVIANHADSDGGFAAEYEVCLLCDVCDKLSALQKKKKKKKKNYFTVSTKNVHQNFK